MDARNPAVHFSEDYGHLRTLRICAGESPSPLQEEVVQCIWYDQLFSGDDLCTDDGRSLRVLSPGWWNHNEGPDFQGAQLEIGGKLLTGDVEVHLDHAAWRQHGHHIDSRYDEVLLVVVLAMEPPRQPPMTSSGRRIPCLLLSHYIEGDITLLADRLSPDDYPYQAKGAFGDCSAVIEACGAGRIETLLRLSGDWRMLNKARAIRERIDRRGPDQALYEVFLTACGYSRFKQLFRTIAQQLPYDRIRQLARRDPLLVEAAFLQIAGLLPETCPEGLADTVHYERLSALRKDHLPGLRRLPLQWRLNDVRPTNYPERRLAGAARFLSNTAREGLHETLERVWHHDLAPVPRRRALEDLFPSPSGFWADRCTWTGKRLPRPVAMLGPSRVRAIIGNVFVPMELALARRARNRQREERTFEFFAKLPPESDNQILKAMLPRLFGQGKTPKLDFRLQQGILQLYYDWCEPNPSCKGCSVLPYVSVDQP
ncbi:MAG: DUF2851 family protein [FCB group bacterium]|jgi:hypothetical protein|nr:DUF2851 family protein [FCB group bacterium]